MWAGFQVHAIRRSGGGLELGRLSSHSCSLGPREWGQPWFGLETPQERQPTLCGEGKRWMVGSGRGVGSRVQAGHLARVAWWSVGPGVVAQAARHTHWALSWAGIGRSGAGARLAPGCWGTGAPQEWPLQEDLGFRAKTSTRGGLVVGPPGSGCTFVGEGANFGGGRWGLGHASDRPSGHSGLRRKHRVFVLFCFILQIPYKGGKVGNAQQGERKGNHHVCAPQRLSGPRR